MAFKRIGVFPDANKTVQSQILDETVLISNHYWYTFIFKDLCHLNGFDIYNYLKLDKT